MGQNLRAVQSFPPESIVGHHIILVPAYLGGHKVAHFTPLHNLRQSRGVTEYVRKPENLTLLAELLPEKCFPIQELAHQRFPGGEIAVCLQPHAALRFPASFFDPLPNLRIHVRSVFFYKFIELGLTGDKSKLRIPAHQFQCCGKTSNRLIPGHCQSPQPGHINVGVSHTADRGVALPAHGLIEIIVNIIFCLPDRSPIRFRVRDPQIQPVTRFIENVNQAKPSGASLRQQTRHVVGHLQIIIKLRGILIQYHQPGLRPERNIRVSHKNRQYQTILRSSGSLLRKQNFRVIHIHPHCCPSIYIQHYLRIAGSPFCLPVCGQPVSHALSFPCVRNDSRNGKIQVFTCFAFHPSRNALFYRAEIKG